MELGRFFGFLHPALVHFPLVLLLVSVALEYVGFLRRAPRVTWMAQVLLAFGTVATLFAFVAGNFAEIWAARDGIPQEPMEQHELLATITSWLFVFLTAGRLYLGTNASRRNLAIYLVFATIGCILLGFTGHRGAMLVYQHGAGVQASGFHAPLPTHEDLAVLRQKQDPDALFYSNQMHHIFGVMVMILSAMLLVDTWSPAWGAKLRKVGPMLLVAGGLFLLVYSDTDSWPLSSQRPITDKEVLMHKTYAILMLFFGIRGLWRRKETQEVGRQMQARAMAVFALIGGALLFTHVHSNAPYANVAVGVYIHHTVMGFIALSIGAVKLLEDSVSPEAWLRKSQGWRWAYPGLMLIQSVFLINYNEGLPWFLGYRRLSLSAPHRGLIAPWADHRAEMTFDPAASRLDFYLLEQDSSHPHPVPETALQAVVKVGTESTVVPLTVQPEPSGGNWHFAGNATFLRGKPMFQAQLLVSRTGQSPLAAPWIADFEPWTDPNAASGSHTSAAYVCPMHPAVGAGVPGRCPVCGMALVPNKTARPAEKLHDDAYRMDFALDAPGGQPQPGQTVRLTLTPRRTDGSVVRDLEIVHTKKLHLIVVRSDLSFFDHVHPEPQPDGSLRLDYAFPAPGSYVLYADCTPTGDRNQVFRLPVTVPGTPPQAQPLVPTPAGAKVFGNYRVSLALSPDTPLARDETQLTFTVEEDGKPVCDLEPYLGAGGHCVALSEDTNLYLHSHPLEMNAERYGPSVTFHALFPHRGLYKIWGQFQHRGKLLTADFVVRVN